MFICLLYVFISFIYVLYRFVIGFYRFSTEELRLATGALRRLSLAKQKVFVGFYKGNIKECNPLIEFKNKMFKTLKSKFPGFRIGFEYFGPRIWITREKLCI